ncbi:hypothetical protein M407DRAFT_146067 [Tulasnella calospora MUT 4182]|uniref:Uncharacterized protein n=1 Tax=Tulasnella calospora MUT 4182 TaxID=1051891 RepID=A0A0C3MAY6_9AGAM|nr:hypothetical protein M407DRAFT_146067 [Tulasnella calospora MUT 4182]
MLVEVDGELRFGGVDDVYEQLEQGGEDADEDEDLFAIHPSRLTRRHRFFGAVEVRSRNILSEKGCSLLENGGADLSTLDEGGVIYVIIRGIFHRYETSSFTQDNGTWITSISGTIDNPWYLSYRVASHHRATYQRCRITRERFWWLEFVRHCCDKIAKGQRATDKRTIAWLIRCYMEMFPRHQSGVHPISDGPPKNTQASEVRLALARNADFIHRKLKTANPRPMNINEWSKFKLTYKRSPVSLEPVYDCASESEEEGVSRAEDKENEGMEIDPSVRERPPSEGVLGISLVT